MSIQTYDTYLNLSGVPLGIIWSHSVHLKRQVNDILKFIIIHKIFLVSTRYVRNFLNNVQDPLWQDFAFLKRADTES